MVGSSPPGVAIVFPRKLVKFDPNCRWQGAKFASVTNFLKNVTNFCSLAVLRGSFVELYNLVHSLTGLTPLVHFFGVVIDHLVGAVAGYGLSLILLVQPASRRLMVAFLRRPCRAWLILRWVWIDNCWWLDGDELLPILEIIYMISRLRVLQIYQNF